MKVGGTSQAMRLARLTALTDALADTTSDAQVAEAVVDEAMLLLDARAGHVTFGSGRWSRTDDAVDGAPDAVTVPLVLREQVLGSLSLEFDEPRTLTADDDALLHLLARQCAQALERVRSLAVERGALEEAREAQGRLELLAHASEVLDRSLDPDETMQSLAALCAPRLGDLCVIDLVRADGARYSRSTAAAANPAISAGMARLRSEHPLDPRGVHPATRVLRAGQAELLPELTDEILIEIAQTEDHLRFMREMRYRSAVVAPLRARGRNLGALSVLRLGEHARPYGQRDLRLIVDIASRAAMALDNAFLYAQREADEAAARFLAESSQLLSGSLEYEQTLGAIAQLAVPTLADWCAVNVLHTPTDVRRVALAYTDAPELAVARADEATHSARRPRSREVVEVLRSGRSRLHPEVTEELLVAAARDEQHLHDLRDLRQCSLMTIPMQARGRVLGAISLAAADSGRRFTRRDIELAEELGRRAGLAVDNARLYENTSHIAVTLQQSLLPPELPAIPGLALAARYRPTGAGNEVGGDFYDVFGLDESTWAVVIGDVCGKGADAAAVTALARYTIRAVATADAPPSQVLAALNHAIRRQRDDERFCTAVYVRISLAGENPSVTFATAGHPRPALRHGDRAWLAGEGGSLLGVRTDVQLSDATHELRAGDAFVLYTDGLLDAGAPRNTLEEEDLLALVSDARAEDAETLAERLEDAALLRAPGGLRDDIAIVVLQVPAA